MKLAAVMWTILTVAAGVGIFVVKYQVQELESQLAAKHRDIERDRATIRVLEAEWAYLNDPGRLRRLSEQHLGFAAPSPKAVLTIDRLPLRAGATAVAEVPPPDEAPVATVQSESASAILPPPETLDQFSLTRIKRLLAPVWDAPAFLRTSITNGEATP